MTTTRADIDDFLAQKRVAFVGLARDPKDFSHALFRELHDRGYDLVPVNPRANELEGKRCFAHVQEIDPPVEGALLMTAPQETERVVRDCMRAGVRRVWMYKGTGRGAVSQAAADFCKQNDIRAVEGYCPFMFLPKASFVHRIHGFLLKLGARYPASV